MKLGNMSYSSIGQLEMSTDWLMVVSHLWSVFGGLQK